MWRELEEEAILIGLELNYFWNLNVKQYEKHINAYNKLYKQKIENSDYLNFLLGKYIAFAVNNPKQYPNTPFLHEPTNTIMSDEDMERQARRNTIKMGGVIK